LYHCCTSKKSFSRLFRMWFSYLTLLSALTPVTRSSFAGCGGRGWPPATLGMVEAGIRVPPFKGGLSLAIEESLY
jgi:hypothetical protein